MARVARFYGWPPAVVLGLSLRQLFRWDDLQAELSAEEHLDRMMEVGIWHMEPKARRQYLDMVRRQARGGTPDPAKPRGEAAKHRLAMILAGKGR